uniref:uracil phosphoribosyltransferase homolog n=1 Tax=Ciona intestinalis TaxID=7719 RepID=UPI000180C625|nr:uracil phosphoribosyltransferase homolog [Ciona intestinalis]|eukprot:XP_002127852.1 uracil phosphoribosyltransferase homolog [Ciona intestinalis]
MPSATCNNYVTAMDEAATSENYEDDDIFAEETRAQLKLIKVNDQVRRLQTIIRDRNTSRSEFVFSSDRLIRLVIEEGLNLLPYKPHTVTTPSNTEYNGIKFDRGNCGVSIIRSGEAMEQGLRDSCRSIRIGKILIQTDDESNQAKVFYAKLPKDIAQRNVLLMYPILSSGNTAVKAIEVLEEHGVSDKRIILLTLFTTPDGADTVLLKYPRIRMLSTEVDGVVPNHFVQKYFGTD